MTELPKRELLEQKLHKAVELARKRLEETVNLWKHVQKIDGICTFNETVREIFQMRELHKQMKRF